MKILLSVLHHSVFGGPHNQLLRLAGPLSSRGWETVAVLPEGPGNAAQRLREAGIQVIQMPLHRPRKTLQLKAHADWILSFLPEVNLIRNTIREERADVVQVAGPMYPQGAVAAYLENVPVVWQLLGLFTPFPIRCLTMPLVLSLSDVVMTTGHAVARAHPGSLRLGRRLVPFYPPVDTHEFRPDPLRRGRAREILGVRPESVLVGTVGNFAWHKGHDLLVRAAGSVQNKFPQTTFRILGTATPSHAAYYSKHVRKLAARMGLLWGNGLAFVEPGNPISELLPAFDIFVMPSRVEGVPTAVLEAMACGLPVIATDVGAVREVVEHGATGRVIAAGNSGALADAITDLLVNPQLGAQMGALARQRAVECYDVNICADQHQKAYELAQSVKTGRLRTRASARPGMSELGH